MGTPQLILRNLADELAIGDKALDNATSLSEGDFGKLLIVAMCPCDRADYAEYLEMKAFSPTLLEIDSQIKKVDPYKLLEDVPVFDTNTLLSEAKKKELIREGVYNDYLRRAHKAFYQMVRVQKPDVIVLLHCQAGKSAVPDVKQFENQEYRAGELDVMTIDNRDILVARGFHPSTYLRYGRRSYSPEGVQQPENNLRQRMMGHVFRLAFEAVKGVEVVDLDLRDEWLTFISEKYGRRRTRAALPQDKAAKKTAKLQSLRAEHLHNSAQPNLVGLEEVINNLTIRAGTEPPARQEPSEQPKDANKETVTARKGLKKLTARLPSQKAGGFGSSLVTMK